jgi:replicative DNA helicase
MNETVKLPVSVEAEKAILGGILLDNALYAQMAAQLTPDDFSLSSHQVIFAIMGKLDGPIDAITLGTELQRRNCLQSVGDWGYLSSLTDGVPRLENLDHYAKLVREKKALRDVIHASTAAASRASEADESSEIIAEAQGKLAQLSQAQGNRNFLSFREAFREQYDSVDAVHEKPARSQGLMTGFRALDTLTLGLRRGELTLLAARPSLGKTSLALNIMANVALRDGKAVAMFSLEMSRASIVDRLMCSEARVNSHAHQRGQCNRDEKGRLSRAAVELCGADLFIHDYGDERPETMIAKAESLKSSAAGLALVVVDYLQLMNGGRRGENRTQEISYISRMMKQMAKRCDVPVLALSQLNRAPEERTGGRPRLSDLRESGQLEQDADVVIFLWREDGPSAKRHPSRAPAADDGVARPQDDMVMASIEKQRNGPVGEFKLAFKKQWTRFENVSYEGPQGAFQATDNDLPAECWDDAGADRRLA